MYEGGRDGHLAAQKEGCVGKRKRLSGRETGRLTILGTGRERKGPVFESTEGGFGEGNQDKRLTMRISLGKKRKSMKGGR